MGTDTRKRDSVVKVTYTRYKERGKLKPRLQWGDWVYYDVHEYISYAFDNGCDWLRKATVTVEILKPRVVKQAIAERALRLL